MAYDVKELQDEKNELIGRMEELRKVDPDNWNEDRETEFNTVCGDIEEKTEQITQILGQRELAAKRDERATQLIDEAKDHRKATFRRGSPTGVTAFGYDSPEQQMMRREQTKEDAFMGCVRRWSGLELRDKHYEACKDLRLDLRRDGVDFIGRPSDNIRGYGGFAAGNGGRMSMVEFDRIWSKRDNSTSPTAGGETIPQGFSYELERAMLAFGGLRRVCRVWQTSGFNPIPWPTTNDTGNKAVLTAELADILAVDVVTAEVIFETYKYTSAIIASQELIEDSAFNLSSLFASMLGERIGRGTATAFAVGTGTAQPEGLLTAAPVGATAALAAFTFDEVLDLIHSVDPAYRNFPSTGFVFNDSTLLAARKLKDLEGRYYWQPGTVVGEPNALFGYPYTVDQDYPDASTGVAFMTFGANEKFVIRDHANYRFYQLNELYRVKDATGFMAMSRHDSHLIDAGTGPIKSMDVT